MEVPIEQKWLERGLRVALVGCGGNGSHMLTNLARIDVSWRALGNPKGLMVEVYDPDVVSEANVGRQLFASSDVGKPKAHVLVNRINAFYGLNWAAWNRPWTENDTYVGAADLVVGCVHDKASRMVIYEGVNKHATYWLDLGNDATTGQVILGRGMNGGLLKRKKEQPFRLPTVVDLLRPTFKTPDDPDDIVPSCSLAGALQRQDLFVNSHMAAWASTLLWQWLKTGKLSIHGYFINLNLGRVTPLPIDPGTWENMGFWYRCPIPKRKIKKVLERSRSLLVPNLVRLVCGHEIYSNGKKWAFCQVCHQEGRFQ